MEALDPPAVCLRGLGRSALGCCLCFYSFSPHSSPRLAHLGPCPSRRARRRGVAQDGRPHRRVPRVSRRPRLRVQRPASHRADRFPAARRVAAVRAGGVMVDRASADFRSYLELYERAPLLELGRLADDVRWKLHPENVVTYIIDRNINYTNVCVADCKFCAFYRRPKHPEGYLLSFEEIGRKIDELKAIGGVQILMQGGHNPYIPFEWYLDLLRYIKRHHPIHIHGFSPSEIDFFAGRFGMSIEEGIEELMAAGLDSIPGGGGEILVQSVRDQVARKKAGADRWLEGMEIAHHHGLRASGTMMYGLGETPPHRIQQLLRG